MDGEQAYWVVQYLAIEGINACWEAERDIMNYINNYSGPIIDFIDKEGEKGHFYDPNN